MEEQNKLAKISSSLPLKLKEGIEISPITGSIQPKKEVTVQVYFFNTILFYFLHKEIKK